MLHFCLSQNWLLSSHILFLLIVSLVPTGEPVYRLPKNKFVSAVFAFGDSIVDPGNNNNLVTIGKANFPPYGKNYKGGIPTGRYSDGSIPPDLIAQELGVKDAVPAYLDPKLRPEDLLTGVSFASGGAGYDPLTSVSASAISMTQQVEFFKEYIEKVKARVGENRTEVILANALFVAVAGSDDIANTYYTLRLPQLRYDISSYTDLMLRYASSFIKEIYELGARRVLVLSAPPIGCVPSQRTAAGGPERECAQDYNEAAILYNHKLAKEIDSLNNKFTDSKIVYVDVYNPLLDMIQNPKKYGFEVVDKGCCGTGLVEVTLLCNALSSTCEDASKYIFWDSFHPTQTAYTIIVNQLINKYAPKFF